MKSTLPFPENIQATALQAVDAARVHTLKHYRCPLDVLHKADASPVTVADRAAEASMRAVIERDFPSHGIYGEEFGVTRPEAEHVWVIDPIDGTRSYITACPLWGTLVAHAIAGVPVLGVIDLPVLNERWVAAKGQGARRDGVPVHVSECRSLAQARIQMTSPDAFDAHEWELVDRISRRAQVRRFGGDCHLFAQLAAGHVDVAIESGLQPYDYMALVSVVTEAGGCISDWAGQPLRLQSCGQLVASATPALHEELLTLLAPLARGLPQAV